MSSKYKNFYHADIEDYIRKYFPKFSELDSFYKKENKIQFYFEISECLNSLGRPSRTSLGSNHTQIKKVIESIYKSISKTRSLLDALSLEATDQNHLSKEYQILSSLRRSEKENRSGEGYIYEQYSKGIYVNLIDTQIDIAREALSKIKDSFDRMNEYPETEIVDTKDEHENLIKSLCCIYKSYCGSYALSIKSPIIQFLEICLNSSKYQGSKTPNAILQELKKLHFKPTQ